MILSRRPHPSAAGESYLEEVCSGAQPESTRSRGGDGLDQIRIERLGRFGSESVEQVVDSQAQGEVAPIGADMQSRGQLAGYWPDCSLRSATAARRC